MNLAEYQAVMNRLAAAEEALALLREEIHDLKNERDLEDLARMDQPMPKGAPKK